MFNQEEFNNFILHHEVIGFFKEPKTLSSGRISNWYVNWRTITEDVYLTDKLTDFITSYTLSNRLIPDCFYGVPEGATKLGILTQDKWAKKCLNFGVGSHCLPMGRGKSKEHGAEKDKYFLGMPKGKTIILEDVTTTGNSLIKNIINLRDYTPSDIIAAFGLTNRNEKRDDGKSVEETLELMGISFYSLSNARELLPLAIERKKPNKNIIKLIEKEFERYGEFKLKLQ